MHLWLVILTSRRHWPCSREGNSAVKIDAGTLPLLSLGYLIGLHTEKQTSGMFALHLDPALFPGLADQFIFDPQKAAQDYTLEELKKRWEQLAGVDVTLRSQSLKELEVQIQENSMYAQRIVSLMASQVPEQEREFFDCPSSDEMYQSFHTPENLSAILGHESANGLQAVVNKIRGQNSDFTENVRKYFKSDLLPVAYFGSVTFSAIYGYFLSTKFCEMAASMLNGFIATADKTEMVGCASMITTFFLSSYSFLSCLWNLFLARVKQSAPKDQTAFQEILVECVEKTSHLFDASRRSVFQSLHRKDPKLCYDVILSRVLYSSFDIFFGYGTFIVDANCMKCMEQILTSHDIHFAKCVIKAILKGAPSEYAVPPKLFQLDIRGSSLYATKRDLFYLFDLAQVNGDLPASLEKWRGSIGEFLHQHSPAVVPYHPDAQRVNDSVCEKMDQEMQRRMKGLEKKAADANRSVFDFVPAGSEFEKFAYIYKIHEKEASLQNLTYRIDSWEKLAHHKRYFEYIKVFYDNLIWKHCSITLPSFPCGNVSSHQLFQHVVTGLRKTLKHSTPAELSFQYIICALNQFKILPDRNLEAVNTTVMKVFNRYRKDREFDNTMLRWPKSHKLEMKKVGELFTACSASLDWGIGRKLLALLTLSEQLQEITRRMERIGVRTPPIGGAKTRQRTPMPMRIFLAIYGFCDFTDCPKLINTLMFIRQLLASDRIKRLLKKRGVSRLLPEREESLFKFMDETVKMVLNDGHSRASYCSYPFRVPDEES